jgi:ankyrin repeat protein
LHIAAGLPRNKKALTFLLENGATLFIDDMQNELKQTPLMIACANGKKSEELTMLLLKFGANAKCTQASTGYNAYDFLLQVKAKGFEPSPDFIEALRVATL